MVSIIEGVRGTADTLGVNADIRVREIGDKIWLKEPNKASLTLLSMKAGKAKVGNPKFEWLERERTPTLIKVNGALTAGVGTWVVDTPGGDYVPVNSLVQSQETGETALVTAATATDLTVTRSVGTVAAAAISDNTDLTILGGAAKENATAEGSRSTKSATKVNYTQIVHDPFGVSGTDDASSMWGGGDLKNIRKERGIEHAVYWENLAFFGEKSENITTGDYPRRTTGGLKEFITTNSQSFSGNVTLAELFTAAESAFRYGSSNVRFLFVSRAAASNLSLVAGDYLRVMSPAKTFGISMSRLVTPHGEWNIISHPLLQGTSYGGYGFSVAIENFQYVYLRDTMLKQNIQANDVDGVEETYLTEGGFRIPQEEVHMEMSSMVT